MSWFRKLLEYLGLVNKALDEVDATLEKAGAPATRIGETVEKAKKLEETYKNLGR